MSVTIHMSGDAWPMAFHVQLKSVKNMFTIKYEVWYVLI